MFQLCLEADLLNTVLWTDSVSGQSVFVLGQKLVVVIGGRAR
jgi:hypothetical protein